MRLLFIAGRLYPFLALSLCVGLIPLGVYFQRRKSPFAKFCWMMVLFLIAGFVAWFMYRGDLYSDRWIREFSERHY